MITLAATLGAFILFALICLIATAVMIIRAPRGCETDDNGFRECDDCDRDCHTLDEMTAIEIQERLAR